MAKPKQTKDIKHHIWRMIMVSFLAFIFIFALSNAFIIKKTQKTFIFHQLEEALNYKIENNHYDDTDTVYESDNVFNHFLIKTNIDRSGDADDNQYEILADKRMSSKFLDSENHYEILTSITADIYNHYENTSSTDDYHKTFNTDDTLYYYYAKPLDSDSIMVYMTTAAKEALFPNTFWIALGFTLLFSFWMTRRIAKKIKTPMNSLEAFAEDIAKQNWLAIPPESDITEIQELSSSLNQMKEIIKNTHDRERQFLQTSSHNLKTPVMVIKGYAQAMIDGVSVSDSLRPEDVILQEANQLEKRIKQLVALSVYDSYDHQKTHFETLRIDRLINHVAKKFEGVDTGLKWEIDLSPCEIKGDSQALITAFETLFENQLRYAKKLIKITLKTNDNIAEATTKGFASKMLSITVSNDGPHFTVENTNCLFDRYQKDTLGESGLGLAILKQIVLMHGGVISADNTEEGVIFKIDFKSQI